MKETEHNTCSWSPRPLTKPEMYQIIYMVAVEAGAVLFVLFCGSVAQGCPTLGHPPAPGCSTPGFPVFHYLPKFAQTMSIESMMPSNHLILCRSLLPLLLLCYWLETIITSCKPLYQLLLIVAYISMTEGKLILHLHCTFPKA